MCGTRSKVGWLLLAALLLWFSPICWAEDYDGPELPEGWYPISETELTELETILTEQGQTISQQEMTLTRLSETIERQRTTIDALAISLTELESGAIASIRRLRIEVWIDRMLIIGTLGLAAWGWLR
jgi:uncharacterized coiled-coil protein SlyX